jgi:hypothetical protein
LAAIAITSPAETAKPVPSPAAPPAPLPPAKTPKSTRSVETPSPPAVTESPERSHIKRKTEVALTAAAIAAIIVKTSRDQY